MCDNILTVVEYSSGAVEVNVRMVLDKKTSDELINFIRSLPQQTQGEVIAEQSENLGPGHAPTSQRSASPAKATSRQNHNCDFCKSYKRDDLKDMCLQLKIAFTSNEKKELLCQKLKAAGCQAPASASKTTPVTRPTPTRVAPVIPPFMAKGSTTAGPAPARIPALRPSGPPSMTAVRPPVAPSQRPPLVPAPRAPVAPRPPTPPNAPITSQMPPSSSSNVLPHLQNTEGDDTETETENEDGDDLEGSGDDE